MIYELTEAGGEWTFDEVGVPKGENIEIKASLHSGNISVSDQIEISNYPDEVSIDDPEDGEQIARRATIRVTASILEGETRSIEVVGIDAGDSYILGGDEPDTENQFEVQFEQEIEAYPGENEIIVSLQTLTGEEITASVTVHYESRLSFISPYRNKLIRDTGFDVISRVDVAEGDTVTVEVYRDEKRVYSDSDVLKKTDSDTEISWSVTADSEGRHFIEVIHELVTLHTDRADTVKTIRRTIIRDDDSEEVTGVADNNDTVYRGAGRVLRQDRGDPRVEVTVSSKVVEEDLNDKIRSANDRSPEYDALDIQELTDLADNTLTRISLSDPTATMRVEIPFKSDVVEDLVTEDFRLYRLDSVENDSAWTQRDIEHVRVESDTVVARVTGFSVFQVMPQLFEDDLSELIYGPNPFRPNDGNELTGEYNDGRLPRFENLPDGRVKVEIYTITGSRVYDGSVVDETEYVWDARNNSGDRVASGYYIWLVEDSAGNTKTGKLAIIR